ncbi:SDR family NAD(P)-dependent oxidoreductase [Alicyclobacillus sp. SO9]|uniref:SDR family NAD(P)-dependent oxidoreductase n=1 Tax=Alicyclobacillus sp. SO9 TaxID=2665646 RepID=UPI0018E73779|nr:SDR family oxidoreductase [Alicyclobacillus sp. SO9]QQE80509.1 SDR family oxidoreductase [Alicyclobacillus sp. SO9]
MNVNYDLSDEVLVITGGASGIGAGLAQAYAKVGGTAVVLDVNKDLLRAIGQVDTGSGSIQPIYCDVGNSAEVTDVFASIKTQYGRVDGLVLSAAIQPRSEVEHMSDEEWHRVIEVNLNSAMYCSRAVVPVMKEQRSGSIVTFSSGLASQGWATASAYATTKAGLITFARSLARELLSHRIRVNALAPGVTDSPLFTGPNTEEEQSFFRQKVGSVGTVEDVVKLLLFLVSDASSSLTGSLINREFIFPDS